MSKTLYESLLAGEPTEGPAGLLGAFARAAETVRREQRSGLAQAEFEDGLYVDETGEPWLDADLDGLALAARDAADLDFPVRYSGGGLTVLLGLDEQGRSYALLERGDGPVEVLGVVLYPGVEQPVDVDAPPSELSTSDGTTLVP